MNFKLCLVTGASSGLGRAVALALAEKNISLILTARNKQKLEETVFLTSSKTSVISLAADLNNLKERHALLKLIQEHTPDLVINNAGFGLYGDALQFSTEEQSEILEVNAQAVVEITLEAARALKKAKKTGTILNVSSAAAFFVYPTFCVYAASKALVNQFSQGMDAELKEFGIRVLTACPGQIDTSFRERASQGFPQKRNFFTMSTNKAAKCLLWQIEKGRTLYTFDARYRIALFFSRHLLPQRWLQKVLKRSIASRYGHNQKN